MHRVFCFLRNPIAVGKIATPRTEFAAFIAITHKRTITMHANLMMHRLSSHLILICPPPRLAASVRAKGFRLAFRLAYEWLPAVFTQLSRGIIPTTE